VIGNSKHPRPFSKVNLEHLPVYYHGNPKAWMNSVVFEEVLLEMDSYFGAQNKKILLLVDNAPSHFDPHYSINQDENSADEIEDDESIFGKVFSFINEFTNINNLKNEFFLL
jgi:hypothetical protein